MFLKSLTIAQGDGTIIQNIQFHAGLNLIVDETPSVDSKETGNNVGKTTVLKLVDFCLGAKAKEIYSDPENRRHEYKLVKEFLIEKKVLISIILKENLLQENSSEVIIERNFLSRKHKIQRLNSENKNDKEFDEALTELLFPGHYGKKPTFRQIIAHNIRYTDSSINNTLKNLNHHTRDDEYETLYLFLFGCDFEQGNLKQELRSQIKVEEKFKKRLESEQTKPGYESALGILQLEIEDLEKRKSVMNLNSDFESDLDKLNRIKYEINTVSAEISRLELRRDLILEAQREMQSSKSKIDMQQLEIIYQQASSLVSKLHKTFQELNNFHNQMVESKIRFIVQELPKLDSELETKRSYLKRLLSEESKLVATLTQRDSFEVLENLITDLNEKYRMKGEYDNVLKQLNDIEIELTKLDEKLTEIDNELFSDESTLKIQHQINKFNRHFSSVSRELYGEQYALKSEPKTGRNGRRLYEFTSFNTNFSSGKKQGEVSCFDIAYTLFADEENIPCMHFLLNDKKELMHDNQLLKIVDLVNAKGIQFVASILKDKLPEELNKDEYVVMKLSQKEKLFRIQEQKR